MNIYVGNLSPETTVEELRKEFKEFGTVLSVTIFDDNYIRSGQRRYYGYVQMPSKLEGTAAITTLTGRTLRDRSMTVVEALPLTQTKTAVPVKIGPLTRRGPRKRAD